MLTIYPEFVISDIVIGRHSDIYTGLYLLFAIIYLGIFTYGFYAIPEKMCMYSDYGIGHGTEKLTIFVVIIFTLIAAFVVDLREIISPAGYGVEYDTIHRGQLTTLFLMSIWWLIYLKLSDVSNFNIRLIFLVILCCGLNLLLLGSRLGFITGIIAFLIYSYFHKVQGGRRVVKIIKFAALAIMAAIGMGYVGVARTGGDVFAEGIITILAAEPIFIYASVPAYFSNSNLELVAIPWDIFSSIVGSVPSFLFPAKNEFFETYTALNKGSESGFGGINHIVLLISNFGLVGFPVVAYFEGALFAMLCRKFQTNKFFLTAGACSVAILPFMMFREGYQTTIKLLLFNFLLLPYLILKILSILKFASEKNYRKNTN